MPEAAAGQAEARAALALPAIRLLLGLDLLPLLDAGLMAGFGPVRAGLARELGLVVPGVQVADDPGLAPARYAIALRGARVATGELALGHLLALPPRGHDPTNGLIGFVASDPETSRPAAWVSPEEGQRLAGLGFALRTPAEVLLGHLASACREAAHALLSLEETRRLLDGLAPEHPSLVQALVPHGLGLPRLQAVLAGLLREGLPIRDLVAIAERLAQRAPHDDVAALIEDVRPLALPLAMAGWADEAGALAGWTLEPGLEARLLDALAPDGRLALPPELTARLLDRLALARWQAAAGQALLLCEPALRGPLAELLGRRAPGWRVLSTRELVAAHPFTPRGVIALR